MQLRLTIWHQAGSSCCWAENHLQDGSALVPALHSRTLSKETGKWSRSRHGTLQHQPTSVATWRPVTTCKFCYRLALVCSLNLSGEPTMKGVVSVILHLLSGTTFIDSFLSLSLYLAYGSKQWQVTTSSKQWHKLACCHCLWSYNLTWWDQNVYIIIIIITTSVRPITTSDIGYWHIRCYLNYPGWNGKGWNGNCTSISNLPNLRCLVYDIAVAAITGHQNLPCKRGGHKMLLHGGTTVWGVY